MKSGHRVVGVATTSAAGRDRVEALLGDVPVLDIPALLAAATPEEFIQLIVAAEAKLAAGAA